MVVYLPPASNREEINLNASWKFHKGDVSGAQDPGFNDSNWGSVNIPHTWNASDGQDGGNYFRGIGWYRKHYVLPSSYSEHQIYLQFNGANIVTDAYINGTHIGTHKGGYGRFRFNITDLMNIGSTNVIAVKVDNSYNDEIPPNRADYTFYGGIYRGVRLLVTDKLQVRTLDYAGPGVYLNQTNVSSSSAALEITAKVYNNYSTNKSVTVRTIITDASNNIVKDLSTTETVNANSGYDFVQNTTVNNPHLWNGRQDPYLYKAYVEVKDGSTVTDLVQQPLGFRFYSVDANSGFSLNGNYLNLRGAAMHQDWKDKGWTISESDIDTNLNLLQEMGGNAVRLTHYQHAQHMYDRCNEIGFVVWAELAFIFDAKETNEFYNNAKNQLRELIIQNYNHPSIIFWSLGNEVIFGDDPTNLLVQLNNLAKNLDSTRITTLAVCCDDDHPSNWKADSVAFNVYFGWYPKTTSDFGPWADNIHSNYPNKNIGIGEYGAGANVYHHQENPPKPIHDGDWHPEEYQNKFHEDHWAQMQTRDYLWCKFIWNMFDFASDGRDEGAQPGINDKGLVTHDRQIKKDAFYWYKANWSSEPFVYITSRRANNRSNSNVTVKVYSNCDSVGLKVDGISQGEKTSTDKKFQWSNLNIANGQTVEAIGTKGTSFYTDSIIWNNAGGQINITSSSAGAEQSGNTKEKSYDNDESSRWSNDGNVANAWIQYNFDGTQSINKVRIKFYQGHTRTYPLKLTVDGQVVFNDNTSTTSGSWIKGFNAVNSNHLKIEMTGNNSDGNGWLSIYEVDIFGVSGAILTISSATAGASETGNSPGDSFDGNTSTRWANNGNLANAWIDYDLGSSQTVNRVRLYTYKGDTRTYPIKIEVDNTQVWSGNTTTSPDFWFDQTFAPTSGRHVKVSMTDKNSGGHYWFSIHEAEIYGS